MEDLTTIENDSIRRHFDEKNNKWYFSIVDIIGLTTKSSDPRNYWKVLKNRLKKEDNQLVTYINQLKMKSSDGKFYLTDVGDPEIILEILKITSPEYIFPFRQYYDNLNRKNSLNFDMTNQSLEISTNIGESYPQEEFILLIDGYREKNIFVIQTFVAGVNIAKLLISATTNTITIQGERKKNENTFSENFLDTYLYRELYWGKFSRTIELPEEIDINQIEAYEQNGLITIKLPLVNKNRSRLLKIKSI